MASKGDAGTGRRAGRRVERASRRWRAALCTAAAGGRNCSGGRSRAGEHEGSEEEDERENVQGLICKIKKIQGPLCKVKFPADLRLK
jgi:hypothetical protein